MEQQLDRNSLKVTDGYVGSMGVSWKTPTADELEKAIAGAMNVENMSREDVISAIASGRSVRWCKSPNYCYDASYGRIKSIAKQTPVATVRCDCGHTVPATQVMRASLGTSCPNCYDRMSN